MADDRAVADLESFLAEQGEPLLRTAVLLAGSKEAGEDLVQAGRRPVHVLGEPGELPARAGKPGAAPDRLPLARRHPGPPGPAESGGPGRLQAGPGARGARGPGPLTRPGAAVTPGPRRPPDKAGLSQGLWSGKGGTWLPEERS